MRDEFPTTRIVRPADVLGVSRDVEARVIKVDEVKRRIGPSIKAANYSEEDLKHGSKAFTRILLWYAPSCVTTLEQKSIAGYRL